MACVFPSCNIKGYSHPCLLLVTLWIMCLFWQDSIFLQFNLAYYLTVETLRDSNFQEEIFTCVAVLHSHKRTESACHLPIWWQSGEMNGLCSINSLQTGIICVSTSVYSFLEAFSPPWQLPVMIFFFCQNCDRSQVKTKESIGRKRSLGIYMLLGFQSPVVQLFLASVCSCFFCFFFWAIKHQKKNGKGVIIAVLFRQEGDYFSSDKNKAL